MAISAFFRRTLGAPLKNDRWSWGAINESTGQLFLRVWADERQAVDGVPCYLIKENSWASTSRGSPERQRQIEMMKDGTQAFGVVCVAKDIHAARRTIESFDSDSLVKFGPVIERGGSTYATIAGQVAARAVRDRIRIPAGVTAEDVREALQRLARREPHPFGISTGWDVLYEGKRYPQKAVLGLAAEKHAVRPLGPYDFTAGECRRVLTRLGFRPIAKGEYPEEDEQDDAAEAKIQQRTDIGATDKLELRKSRRGQGVYRSNLQKFEKRCRLTGLKNRSHLRASHIKPWRACTDAEKLDGNNGLLLSPHVDHLFDRGYISFTDAGDILVADALDERVLRIWGIATPCNIGKFGPEQCRYLAYHRQEVFKGREDQ
jgi:hypothetical protein